MMKNIKHLYCLTLGFYRSAAVFLIRTNEFFALAARKLVKTITGVAYFFKVPIFQISNVIGSVSAIHPSRVALPFAA